MLKPRHAMQFGHRCASVRQCLCAAACAHGTRGAIGGGGRLDCRWTEFGTGAACQGQIAEMQGRLAAKCRGAGMPLPSCCTSPQDRALQCLCWGGSGSQPEPWLYIMHAMLYAC